MRFEARIAVVVAGVATLMVLAGPALAHVSVEAENTRPNAESEYTLSVPNESDSAETVRIDVELPEGLEVTELEPARGWEMQLEDGVLVIEGGRIAPGESREFRFTATNPAEQSTLTFPAIQTYSDGEEVRWVGQPGSDRPAAQVEISVPPVPADESAAKPRTQPTESAAQAAADPTPAPASEVATTTAAPSAVLPLPVAPAPQAEALGDTPSSTGPAAGTIAAVVLAAALVALLLWVARRGRDEGESRR